jgi:transcriptional accessory protein Tex/SPT6
MFDLSDIANINSILDPNAERSHYKQIADLKLAAKTLVFIQQNHISDLGELADKVGAMSDKRDAISKALKDNERRTKTLDEHIRHGENFTKYRKYKAHYEKLYSEYKTLRNTKGFFADKKTQKALDDAKEYYEAHRPDLAQYDSAEDYLKKVMQSRFNGKG